MDQITDTTIQMEEYLVDIQEGSVFDSKEMDSYVMGLPIMHALGKVNSLHQGPSLHQYSWLNHTYFPHPGRS